MKRKSLMLSLMVTAAVLVGVGAAHAQTERRVPGADDGEEPVVQPSSVAVPQCPSQVILAGVEDDFAAANNSVELTAPSAALQAWIDPPYAQLDGTQIDQHFIHTFRLPPCKCLVGAKLEFRARALGACGPSSSANDAVTLGFSTLSGSPHWTAYLGSGQSPTLPALSTTCWGSPPLVRVFNLDLGALPPNGTSLLSAMQTNKYLDIYVQDDTSIDYVKLTTTMCDCCQTTGRVEICISKFYDRNRNGEQDAATEPGLPGWTFQVKDQAGGNLITSPPTQASGGICFAVPAPATYVISEVPQPGWIQTTPVPANPVVTVSPGGPVVNLAFGNWRARRVFDGAPGAEKVPDRPPSSR